MARANPGKVASCLFAVWSGETDPLEMLGSPASRLLPYAVRPSLTEDSRGF